MKSDVRLCGEEEVLLIHIITVPIFIRLCNQAKDLELEPLKVGGSRQTSRVSPGSLPDLRPGVKKTPQPQLALPKSGWSQPDCHSSYNGSTVSKPGSFACTLTTSNTGVTNIALA